VLKITRPEYEAIRHHAERAYPEECCGVLLGRMHEDHRMVLAAVACGNVRHDSPRDRYAIDPRDMVRIQREGRECGLEIVGFYHSHPDHAAEYSTTDLAEAHWLGCSYVITAVEQGSAAQTSSFLLAGGREEEKRFAAEPMEVLDGAAWPGDRPAGTRRD
jgi:proteasome lid subunit RPN8/RPN11